MKGDVLRTLRVFKKICFTNDTRSLESKSGSRPQIDDAASSARSLGALKLNSQHDAMDGLTPCGVFGFRFLWMASFLVAFSLPAGRVFVALSLVALIVDCIRCRRYPVFSFSAWCWVAFFCVAVLASATGVDPARSFGKIDKLLWFAAIPITATYVAGDYKRIEMLLRAFAIGCGVLAIQIAAWRPVMAWFANRDVIAAGGPSDYLWAITDLGSMTNGQTLMVGIVALAGVILGSRIVGNRSVRRQVADWVLLILLVLALVMNLKRGSWICTFLVVGMFIAAQMKLRHVLILAAVAIGILMLPPVWSRFSDLKQELDVTRGGRIVMWTKIAPPIIKAHPLGIGYRALTEDMMKEVAAEQGVCIESQRDHLHSNPIQVLVALGWGGLALYLVWIIAALANGIILMRLHPHGSAERVQILSVTLMLAALVLNGFIEYNLGDAELVIPYAIILGILSLKRI